jgi:hypothetical protein
MNRGEPVHFERIVDGDATTLTAVVLYTSGGVTVRTLASDEFLTVTEFQIVLESGGDYSFVADTAVAGRYLAFGNAAANGGIEHSARIGYTCPKGVTPKFAGAGTNRSTCIGEGYISK